MKRVDKTKNFRIPTRAIKMKRMRVKARKSVAIREVSNDNLHVSTSYNYVVHFLTNRISFDDRLKDTKAVAEFSNHGFNGRWRITYSPYHYTKLPKLMDRLYLEDESDLIMLRLCNNLKIDRILKIKH
jgi:hypothetical protein